MKRAATQTPRQTTPHFDPFFAMKILSSAALKCGNTMNLSGTKLEV